MDYHVGDAVVHWAYGLGEIIGLEERDLSGRKIRYYLVKIQNQTVFVPVDKEITNRLRPPTSRQEFKRLFKILSGSSEDLLEDRFDRKTQLHKELADGKAENLCRIVRDLTHMAQKKSLNDDDKNVLDRTRGLLCSEWEFSLSMPREQVERELHRMLNDTITKNGG